MTPTPLLNATRNRHKTRELAALLGSAFAVEDLGAYPQLPEVEETGDTFEANAALKAVSGSQHYAGLVLADDSGLEADFLHGAPGVRSARFAGEKAGDRENCALLLDKMQGVPEAQRGARFRCVIAIAQAGKLLASFHGACEGRLTEAPRGCDGFGYDPVFVPQGYEKTFAQLPAETKNALSHRGQALQAARAWLAALSGR